MRFAVPLRAMQDFRQFDSSVFDKVNESNYKVSGFLLSTLFILHNHPLILQQIMQSLRRFPKNLW